jgi:hypothetical protein
MTSSQLRSKLLQIPYDVRHQIYTYFIPPSVHVFVKDGRARVSECVPLPVIKRDHPGWERGSGLPQIREGESSEDWHRRHRQAWADRYDLSWGTHWKCEEKMLAAGEGDALDALLQTCVQM